MKSARRFHALAGHLSYNHCGVDQTHRRLSPSRESTCYNIRSLCLPRSFALNHLKCFSSILGMLLLVSILLIFRRNGSLATPLPESTSKDVFSYVFPRNEFTGDSERRSIWDILRTCLATTFTCTWVSVHPNVPFLGESKWVVLRRRLFLMLLSLLAPEIMIMWAFKQWRGAVMIRETVNRACPKLRKLLFLWHCR